MKPMSRVHTISFRHALIELAHATSTQPNFTVHLVFSILAIIAGIALKISGLEWIIIALTIAVGLVIELVNTAIESAVNLITRRYHRLARIAKDTAAAAMLVYAISTVIIAVIIFIPKIWRFI